MENKSESLLKYNAVSDLNIKAPHLFGANMEVLQKSPLYSACLPEE